ncbi:sugar-phosphatase [Arthrobacter subterraneus]|uniref:Sugar-phosphatase n=1 Tax=Arthrobacter subterraneus TaxID=335973 RepID=A0A1G8MBQ4_9MICC|nr:HAD-IA family hydrolase [Arthrobacter subterraneus]SDI64830.1 sugar-phosphatase [Arthrobacter subterraneus]
MTNVENLRRSRQQIATLHVDELLFDMDGTLIDSIAAVESAWSTLAKEEGVTVPSGGAFHGRTAVDLLGSLVVAERLSAALKRLEELESSPTAPVMTLPGATELLTRLPPNRWSIVTSAARSVAEARLTAAGLGIPAVLVTGDDVARGKPDPAPYLAGRRHSGRALAFEDTVAGLKSARGAGCDTVAIVGTATAEELSPYADFVVESLVSVTVASADHEGIRIGLQLVL